jgi:membrane-associated phospholipid phosphatase
MINAKPARTWFSAATVFVTQYRLEESATIFMLIGLNAAMAFFADFNRAKGVFCLNVALVAVIFFVSWVQRSLQRSATDFLRDWYLLPILIIIYLQLRIVIPLVHPHDADTVLIAIDRWIFFGHDPTVLLEPFLFRPVVEILQVVYASFYFLPLSLCVVLYLQQRKAVFHTVVSAIIIAFYVSYIGYFAVPAIGPQHTLAHLQNVELSGVWSFGCVRGMLNYASGIARDCFPSGHTMISLVTVFLALRYEKKFAPVGLLWATALIFSTVYLRYHYVIDVLAGTLLAFVYMLALPFIEKTQFRASRFSSIAFW